MFKQRAEAMTRAEWLVCQDPDDMLKYLGRRGNHRKLRLFCCACYRHIPRFIQGECIRIAVEVSERYVDGFASKQELARALSLSSVEMLRRGGQTVFPTPRCAGAVRHITALAARDGGVERKYQAGLLRDIFGLPPFRPIAVARSWLAWNDRIVQKLAESVYQERSLPDGTLSNARLAVLADALEEAGCHGEDILQHCRQKGQVHVRGCWVLDLILGKE